MARKILILHNRYVEKGGEDTTAQNEYELLKANGIDVEYYMFNNGGSKIIQLLKFLFYPVNIVSFIRVINLVNKYKPDAVHIHNFFYAASPLVFWALRFKKIPFVVTVQNFRLICPSSTLFHKGQLYLRNIKYPFRIKASFEKVYKGSFLLTFWLHFSNYIHYLLGTWDLPEHYIFVSSFSKHIHETSFFRKYKHKFTLKYNFIKDPSETPYTTSDRYVMYIGRLTEEKGIHVLLKTFAANSIPLKIIGDGALKEMVQTFCKTHSHVQYLGFKSKQEVLELVGKSSALIFPSLWFEGMPLTIVEALSTGTPVIASEMGAMKEMVINGVNGFTFHPGDPDDLNKKLQQLMQKNEQEIKAMRAMVMQDFKKRFSAEESFDRLISLYSGLASNEIKMKHQGSMAS